MFPWMGQMPGQQQGVPPGLAMLQQLMRGGMFGRGGWSGGPMASGDRTQFDWSNPLGSIGQGFRSGPLMDNSGLSALWSRQMGPTQSGPLGWQTTTNSAQSPLGGLLGKIGGWFR